MKIGLQIPNFTYPDGPSKLGKNLADIARTADAGPILQHLGDGSFLSDW